MKDELKEKEHVCHCQNSGEHQTCACENHEHKDNKKCKNHDKKNKHEEELKEKDNKIKELEEKVKYAQAELINYRKRKEEETTDRLKYANQELISELIIILDNFERAIKLDDNNLSDELSKFLKGFKMMYASFDELLKKHGLVEIEAMNKIYDPKVMEALMTTNDENYKDEEVIEVLLKGYKLKDRVIRPAAVRVNKLENNNENKGEDENE